MDRRQGESIEDFIARFKASTKEQREEYMLKRYFIPNNKKRKLKSFMHSIRSKNQKKHIDLRNIW